MEQFKSVFHPHYVANCEQFECNFDVIIQNFIFRKIFVGAKIRKNAIYVSRIFRVIFIMCSTPTKLMIVINLSYILTSFLEKLCIWLKRPLMAVFGRFCEGRWSD